ncbi:MAG: Crp/Fnr family transcriptional regulator [Pseudolabrys sp.]
MLPPALERAMKNLFLDSLSKSDLVLLTPLLRPMELAQETVLSETGDTVTLVHFPINAIISLVIVLSSGEIIETAMVGRDGMVGASSALDGNIAMNKAIVQLSGKALVCDASAFKESVLQSRSLLSKIIRHEQTVYAQAQQSAACIASHNIESRLARWLLRSRDLADSNTLPFTQEFLSEMLGVRRTTVSVVAHALQHAGMIKYRRGKIQITDLDALEEASCECYGTIKDLYNTLLGVGSAA